MTGMPDSVRAAIERLMVDYCCTLDTLADIDALEALFTPDAVTDMTAIGLPLMKDRNELRGFFEGVFANLSHSFHMIGNFRPVSWDGSIGVMSAHVNGMGQPKEGERVTMQVRYEMACLETPGGWKCRRYTVTPMMPLPA